MYLFKKINENQLIYRFFYNFLILKCFSIIYFILFKLELTLRIVTILPIFLAIYLTYLDSFDIRYIEGNPIVRYYRTTKNFTIVNTLQIIYSILHNY